MSFATLSSDLLRKFSKFLENEHKFVVEGKDPNLIAKISGHVENSRAFSRYRDIDEEMAKEVILKLE